MISRYTIHRYEELLDLLQESLRFSLCPESRLKEYGRYGLDLMWRLIRIDCHLPLFVTADIVCSFFSAASNFSPLLDLVPVHDENFGNLYAQYPSFLNKILHHPSFKRIENLRAFDRRRMVGTEQNGQMEAEKLLYHAYAFILAGLAIESPFFSSKPIYNPELLASVAWESLQIPKRTGFDLETENQLLTRLGLDTIDHNRAKTVPAGKKSLSQTEALIETISHTSQEEMDKYMKLIKQEEQSKVKNPDHPDQKKEDEKLQHQKRECFHAVLRFPHLFDYKLIDLYLTYYDKFEVSDELRQKIAWLKFISRLAIERSPFNSEYSRQWPSGLPNPAHLGQGWQRFLLKALEGEPVFLGNPYPIRDQDNIGLRFYMIEEMKSASEKISDTDIPRFSHLNIHKLISLLLCHDLVRYLGMISRMDIIIRFFTYRVINENPVRATEGMSVKSLGKIHKTEEGFMIKIKDLQKNLFLEANILETASSSFDFNFFNKFFEHLDSFTSRSFVGYTRIYDLFFGRGGVFLYENDQNISLNTNHLNTLIQKEEFNPSQGIKDILHGKCYRILPNQPRAFIFETNHRYLFVVGNPGTFQSQVISHKLPDFLNYTREYFLNLIVEEAIRFRLGYLERMKR